MQIPFSIPGNMFLKALIQNSLKDESKMKLLHEEIKVITEKYEYDTVMSYFGAEFFGAYMKIMEKAAQVEEQKHYPQSYESSAVYEEIKDSVADKALTYQRNVLFNDIKDLLFEVKEKEIILEVIGSLYTEFYGGYQEVSEDVTPNPPTMSFSDAIKLLEPDGDKKQDDE